MKTTRQKQAQEAARKARRIASLLSGIARGKCLYSEEVQQQILALDAEVLCDLLRGITRASKA